MENPTRETTFTKALKVVPLSPPFLVVGPRDMEVLDVLPVQATDGNWHPALLVAVDERAPTGHKHTFSVLGVGLAVPEYCEKYIGNILLEGKYLLVIYKDREDAFDDKAH